MVKNIFTSNSMNSQPTLTAFVSKDKDKDEKKTYNSGDKVTFKQGENERIGELHYNGWSIYDMNTSNEIAVLDPTTLERKGITMTPYVPPQSQPSVSATPVYGNNYGAYDSYPTSGNGWGGYGGKRSRRRSMRSRKSRKSRKSRR
jgi:hypothetical protein